MFVVNDSVNWFRLTIKPLEPPICTSGLLYQIESFCKIDMRISVSDPRVFARPGPDLYPHKIVDPDPGVKGKRDFFRVITFPR